MAGARTAGRVSPARACAYDVLRRVFEQGAYTDRAFAARAAALQPRDRALAMRLCYGTVQRRAALDHVAAQLSRRALRELEAPVVAAVRLGLFQLLYLDGIADHAAVNESVELVKRVSPGGARLVNAVLRRAAREGVGVLASLHDDDAAGAATMHSVPVWLADCWWSELGAETARALLRVVNEPAESALRVNTLVAGVEEVGPSLPVAWAPAPAVPEGVVLRAPFDAHGSELWRRGAIMPQSRASMLVSRVLCPAPGERVLDLCAAPGGKTTHLAALMGDQGAVVAVERHPGRAEALRRTCERMHAACVRVEVEDAAALAAEPVHDRVLVDPPCSGLGTLQSRPDLRWRATPQAVDELFGLQSRILAAAGAALRPGGVLVYSVCTISRRESEDVLEAFLSSHGDFSAEDLGAEHPEWAYQREPRYLQLLPHRDGTDGFFLARLRRGGG